MKKERKVKITVGLALVMAGLLISYAISTITPETIIKTMTVYAFLNIIISILIILLGDNYGNVRIQ